MGIQLMEQRRLAGVEQVRPDRHRLLLPEVHAGARSARTTSGTATRRRRTRRTAWPRRCCSSRARRTASSTASTSIHLIPVNLYGPGDNFDPATSHVIPALIRKCVERASAARTTSRSGAPAAPRASSCTSRTRPRASCSATERYDGAEPVNLGAGREITIRELVDADRAAHRLRGRDPLGRDQARRPAAARARHEPRPRALRLRGDARRSRTACGGRSTGTRSIARARSSARCDRSGPDRRRHRCRGPGRLLPRGAAARGGIRRSCHDPLGRGADGSRGPPERRPSHDSRAGRHGRRRCRTTHRRCPARRAVQPRRPEQRQAVLRRPVDRVADERPNGAGPPRGAPNAEPDDALLPGVVDGHVRVLVRRHDHPRRALGVPAPEPVRRVEGRRPRLVRRLPPGVRPPDRLRDPLEPRVAQAARFVPDG